ncbi:hypothetical protein [Corynebacterium uberis]|uniref:hypothetical protein n=1 Tax=Corynebacterium uberis TaxID=2883169 RepID=UPI001D0A8858|nr:hypothetical protein [Corynebacterium uberis]UDL79256.1 hypothetical protein LH394_08405 [Corynebacterium uberis]
MTGYAAQVRWLNQALKASIDALTGQDHLVAQALAHADRAAGHLAQHTGVVFPPRPPKTIEPFVFTPPLVAPATSLAQLSASFAATQVHQATQSAATWAQMAAEIGKVAAGLASVAISLSAHNHGLVFTKAAAHIAQVANNGRAFATNAALVGSATEGLVAAHSAGASAVQSAASAINAIPDVELRLQAEASFLQSFPGAFTPMLAAAIPPVNNLMDLDSHINVGALLGLDMSAIPGAKKTYDPAELVPAGQKALDRLVDTARYVSENPQARFEEVHNNLQHAERIGANSATTTAAGAESAATQATHGAQGLTQQAGQTAHQAGQAAQQAANAVGAGGEHAVRQAGTQLGSAPGPQAHPGGTATSPLAGMGGANQQGQTGGAPRVVGSSGGGIGAHQVGTHASSTGVPLAPMGPMAAGLAGAGGYPVHRTPGVGGGAMSPGAGSVFGAGQVGLPGGAGMGAGLGGAGLGGAGLGAGLRAGMPGSGGSFAGSALGGGPGTPQGIAGAAGVGASRSASAGRGMVPMMGAANPGAQNKKRGPVKAVTSKVERKGNLKALLGDPEPVVPGVIGAWVRD